jgi:hypothetical protein
MQFPLDDKRQIELQKRLTIIKNQQTLQFPDFNSYPYQIREIFELFKATIHKEDLLDFAKGRLFRDNIIIVYFKILEKICSMR